MARWQKWVVPWLVVAILAALVAARPLIRGTTAAYSPHTQIATGAMLGSGYNPRWFYVRHDGGAWQPTYAGTALAGRLMNFRAIQAVFDDESRSDDNPQANTDEFVRHIPEYADHGVMAVTVGLQGGKTKYATGVVSAFNPDGSLKSAWMARTSQVIEAADANGMVVILSYFYDAQDGVFKSDDAVRAAVKNATDWLIAHNYRNVIIEIANEFQSGYRPLISNNSTSNGIGELIRLAQSRFANAGYRLPVSASSTGLSWSGAVRDTADLALIHGNNTSSSQDASAVAALVTDSRVRGPVVMNEDWNGDDATSSTLSNELAACDGVVKAGGSWGLHWRYYLQYVPFPFNWALGDSTSLTKYSPTSDAGRANYFRAVLEHIQGLAGGATASPAGSVSSGVAWSSPTDGATVSGKVTLAVSAPSGTAKVVFKVDGSAVGNDTSANPWSLSYDTTKVSDGQHTLQAVAKDSAGSVLGKASISVSVQNKLAPEGTLGTATPTPTPTSSGSGAVSVVKQVAGDDWSLPGTVGKAAHSGIYAGGAKSMNQWVTAYTPMLTWAELETGPGQYNWSLIDQKLNSGPIMLRIKNGTPDEVPSFLRSKYGWWSYYLPDKNATIIPGWQKGWTDEWSTFIHALGARYKDNPKLIGLQIQHQNWGGEPGTKMAAMSAQEAKGFSPQVWQDFLTRYLSASLDAFSGQEWKVLPVHRPYFMTEKYTGKYSEDAYADATRSAMLPLFGKGMGLRMSGKYEEYEQRVPWSDAATVTADGVLVAKDTTFAPYLDHAHVDNQIEAFAGTNDQKAYAIRIATLRMLAEHHTHFWLNGPDAALVNSIYPGFMDYTVRELGKTIQESPDGFVLLGQFGSMKAMSRGVLPIGLGQTGGG
ncbi:MAG: cellulase family glycosylhydrolase, partial [Thermomicrobiaceae bacterium]|nr:cellulase family glycosylhydrolase [Thermomicrobiaceae bacterium]